MNARDSNRNPVATVRLGCTCSGPLAPVPVFVNGTLACSKCGTPLVAEVSAPSEFTQDRRPAWAATRGQYLAAWRELRDEGHSGVRARGKVRTMTAEAAELIAKRSDRVVRARLEAAPKAERSDGVDEALAELGARRAG